MLRAKGSSMIEKGIVDGEVLFVKKQETAEAGQIVIALIDEDATAKIFLPRKDKVILRAANSSTDKNGNRLYPDIIVKECRILGVVDNVLHRL